MEMMVVVTGVLVALAAALGRVVRADGSRGRTAGAAAAARDWAEGTTLELPRSTSVPSARMGR